MAQHQTMVTIKETMDIQTQLTFNQIHRPINRHMHRIMDTDRETMNHLMSQIMVTVQQIITILVDHMLVQTMDIIKAIMAIKAHHIRCINRIMHMDQVFKVILVNHIFNRVKCMIKETTDIPVHLDTIQMFNLVKSIEKKHKLNMKFIKIRSSVYFFDSYIGEIKVAAQ